MTDHRGHSELIPLTGGLMHPVEYFCVIGMSAVFGPTILRAPPALHFAWHGMAFLTSTIQHVRATEIEGQTYSVIHQSGYLMCLLFVFFTVWLHFWGYGVAQASPREAKLQLWFDRPNGYALWDIEWKIPAHVDAQVECATTLIPNSTRSSGKTYPPAQQAHPPQHAAYPPPQHPPEHSAYPPAQSASARMTTSNRYFYLNTTSLYQLWPLARVAAISMYSLEHTMQLVPLP